MRILFDNGTPRQLRPRLFGHEVEEARERGWDTLSNGDLLDRAEEAGFDVWVSMWRLTWLFSLLDRAEEAGFDVLLTTHKSLRYQQNMSNRRIAVVTLMNADWNRISRQTERIRAALEGLQPGEVREVPIPMRDQG